LEIAAVLERLRCEGSISAQSLPRVADLAARFERFAEVGLGRSFLTQVEPGDVAGFVQADSAAGEPSAATMHLRRTTLRLLFRTARQLGFLEGDPTLDVALPPREPLRTRPLVDEEVALCRSASLHSLTSTRLAAAWALSEATARTAELPRLTIADLDLAERRVWIHGGRATPRWGQLEEWGAVQLQRHLASLPSHDPEQRIVYRGDGSAESRQAAACMIIGEILTRAGLHGEPGVRPLSVVAWTGRQVLDETGRIDEAARRIGLTSLDRTAALLGFDWRDR
jgi:integrase/recombinase XerC